MPDRSMHLEIITPARVVYEKDIKSLTAPGVEGSLGILPGHAPLVARLATGIIKVRESIDQEPLEMFVSGGFMEVEPHRVVVMADIAEKPDEIDAARALAAKERAEARLREQMEQADHARARASLQRAMYRLKVAQHHKHR
ncbi:MAG: F0F1 ATP synthase subunit epsilon [Bacillota bacterium]